MQGLGSGLFARLARVLGAAALIGAVCSGCLATEAAGSGRTFGSYLDTAHATSPKYLQRLQEFSQIEVWSSWSQVEPCSGCWNFSRLDQKFALVKSLGVNAKSSALLWGIDAPAGQPGDVTPDYLEHMTPAQLRVEVRQHIQTIVRRYPWVRVWNVVNEPFEPPNRNGNVSMRHNVFRDTLGSGWIREALIDAYDANPRATFVAINEYNADGVNAKSTTMLNYYRSTLVGAIPSQHLAVGLQMHLDSCPGFLYDTSPSDVYANMKRFAAVGVRVHISEMDYQIRCVPGTWQHKLEVQADKYFGVTSACMAVSLCRSISVWGVGDSDSWIRWAMGERDAPLLFDDEYNPKPAYWGVVAALGHH
jgi:endo-1,4-beta-xylanase